MKNFEIITNQAYVEVLQKILSDCRVSGDLPPEVNEFLAKPGIQSRHKPYKCNISNNHLSIEMPIPHRYGITPRMYLEITMSGNRTKIHGSFLSNAFDASGLKIVSRIIAYILFGFFLFLLAGLIYGPPLPSDWIFTGVIFVLFLTFLALSGKKNSKAIVSEDSYEFQMGNWISNLFPGELKVLEK